MLQVIDDLPAVIDWSEVFDSFTRQSKDLYAFLATVRIEGRPLTEEERIDGYCAILSNEDWVETWDNRTFSMAAECGWEYAVIKPPKTLNQ